MKWEFEEELKKYGYSKECIDQVDFISEGIILEIVRTLKPDKEACFNRLERYRICLEALYELNAKKKEIEKNRRGGSRTICTYPMFE